MHLNVNMSKCGSVIGIEFGKNMSKEEQALLSEGLPEIGRAKLNPRDAFYGGRTNATCLFYETRGEEKIRYVDFCSLYPYTNKYCAYPVGHPLVITENFGDISTLLNPEVVDQILKNSL